jgi:hypothetical protein
MIGVEPWLRKVSTVASITEVQKIEINKEAIRRWKLATLQAEQITIEWFRGIQSSGEKKLDFFRAEVAARALETAADEGAAAAQVAEEASRREAERMKTAEGRVQIEQEKLTIALADARQEEERVRMMMANAKTEEEEALLWEAKAAREVKEAMQAKRNSAKEVAEAEAAEAAAERAVFTASEAARDALEHEAAAKAKVEAAEALELTARAATVESDELWDVALAVKAKQAQAQAALEAVQAGGEGDADALTATLKELRTEQNERETEAKWAAKLSMSGWQQADRAKEEAVEELKLVRAAKTTANRRRAEASERKAAANQERLEATQAEEVALVEQREAEEATVTAKRERTEALKAKVDAEASRAEVMAARVVCEARLKACKEAQAAAETQKEEAKKARDAATEETANAMAAREHALPGQTEARRRYPPPAPPPPPPHHTRLPTPRKLSHATSHTARLEISATFLGSLNGKSQCFPAECCQNLQARRTEPRAPQAEAKKLAMAREDSSKAAQQWRHRAREAETVASRRARMGLKRRTRLPRTAVRPASLPLPSCPPYGCGGRFGNILRMLERKTPMFSGKCCRKF